jgi:S-adenosylmethionine:tRNA-ribosyltransferase-isomerase (queuine synthetase)
LLVIDRATGRIEHTRFDKIAEYLRGGDLLVFNSSRTLPASLRGCECGATHGPCMEVRLAERLPDDSWLALLLCEQGDPFGCGLRAGMKIDFTESLNATVLERDCRIPRLWNLRFSISGTELVDLIYRLGKPIRYEYVSRRGTSIITKRSMRLSRAQLRCRQPVAHLAGSCCSISSVAVSTPLTSSCTPGFPLTWMTTSIAFILRRKKNIS